MTNEWILSGEDGELLGAYETEQLANEAAWEYSEIDGSSKEETIAYLENNTSVDHIKDVFKWAHRRYKFGGASILCEVEEYAIKNYKNG